MNGTNNLHRIVKNVTALQKLLCKKKKQQNFQKLSDDFKKWNRQLDLEGQEKTVTWSSSLDYFFCF